MKAIIVYKSYHDMDYEELWPKVIRIKEDEVPEDVLRIRWEFNYNGAIADDMMNDNNDPIDEDKCWCKEDMALITWEDGDTMQFYIVDVK